VRVIPTNGGDDILMVSQQGMTIRFSEDDVRPMGRAAAGVRGMKMRAGDEVVSCDVARDDVAILIVTDAGYGKRTQLERFNAQGRGGQGVPGIKLTAKKGHVVAAFMVGLDDEIFVIARRGWSSACRCGSISSQGRDATGVRVMNLDGDQTVAAVAPVLSVDDASPPPGPWPTPTGPAWSTSPPWTATSGWWWSAAGRWPRPGPGVNRFPDPMPATRSGERPVPWRR
jgi:DNA gyrase subunit A